MMKKIIFALSMLVLIPSTALAWNDCPHGEVDCPSPGDCDRYVDTDDDGLCDHSQPTPEDKNDTATIQVSEEEIHELISGKDLKTKTVSEIAELYQIDPSGLAKTISEHLKTNVNPKDSFQLLHDNYGLEPSTAKDIATAIRLGTEINISETTEPENKRSERIYHLVPISLFLIVLYIISHIFSKRSIISVVNHRKIWNALLLITFLISGILGILLVVRINFGVAAPLPFNIMFWHVEIGIAMMVISVFHISWHWSYFKNLLKIR